MDMLYRLPASRLQYRAVLRVRFSLQCMVAVAQSCPVARLPVTHTPGSGHLPSTARVRVDRAASSQPIINFPILDARHIPATTPSVYPPLLSAPKMSTTMFTALFLLTLTCNAAHLTTLSRRQQTPLTFECHLYVLTDVWTTCQNMLDRYDLTPPDFVLYNPSVSYDCGTFTPGAEYCSRIGSPPSTLLPHHS